MNAPQALYWYHQQPRTADYRNSSANRTGPYITELDMTGQPGVFKLVKYVPEAEVAAEREKVAQLRAALERIMQMDVNGHALQDRLQFSPAGRAILHELQAALAIASPATVKESLTAERQDEASP